VTAARSRRAPLIEIRYEDLAAEPSGVAAVLARALDAPVGPLAEALMQAHRASVGRYRTDLSAEHLADVEDEAGELLRELGYVPD
jgi:LPS sulfotransferase NodH